METQELRHEDNKNPLGVKSRAQCVTRKWCPSQVRLKRVARNHALMTCMRSGCHWPTCVSQRNDGTNQVC